MWEGPIHERLLRPATTPVRPQGRPRRRARPGGGGRTESALVRGFELRPATATETEKQAEGVLTSAPPALSRVSAVYSPRGAAGSPAMALYQQRQSLAERNRVEVLRKGRWSGFRQGGEDDERELYGAPDNVREKDAAVVRQVESTWKAMGPDRWGPWKKRRRKRLDLSRVTIPVRQLRSTREAAIDDGEVAGAAGGDDEDGGAGGGGGAGDSPRGGGVVDPVLQRVEARLAELRADPRERRKLHARLARHREQQHRRRTGGGTAVDHVERNVELFEDGYHRPDQRRERLHKAAQKRDRALDRAHDIVDRIESLRAETAGRSRHTLTIMRAEKWAAALVALRRVEHLGAALRRGRERRRLLRLQQAAARRIVDFWRSSLACDPNVRLLRNLSRIKVRIRHLFNANRPRRRAADYVLRFCRDFAPQLKALKAERERQRLANCKAHLRAYGACTDARVALLERLWTRTLVRVATDAHGAFRSARAGAHKLYVPDHVRRGLLRKALRQARQRHVRFLHDAYERHVAEASAFTPDAMREMLAADSDNAANKLVHQSLHDSRRVNFVPPPMLLLRDFGEPEMRALINEGVALHSGRAGGVKVPKVLKRQAAEAADEKRRLSGAAPVAGD